jgi:hypothetical protein
VGGRLARLISSGSLFEVEIGYSRALVDGDWIFVSGTTGFDYATMTISDDVAKQAEQALRNIGAALAEAGASFADIVRALNPAADGGFRSLLADVAALFRGGATSRHDDCSRPCRSAHED